MKAGSTEGQKCTACGMITIKPEETKKLDHVWEDINNDDLYHVCMLNGVATGHAEEHTYDEGKVTKEATPTEKGVKTYNCKNDASYTYTEVIPAAGHTVVVDPEVPATCAEPGKTEGTHCGVCGES